MRPNCGCYKVVVFGNDPGSKLERVRCGLPLMGGSTDSKAATAASKTQGPGCGQRGRVVGVGGSSKVGLLSRARERMNKTTPKVMIAGFSVFVFGIIIDRSP